MILRSLLSLALLFGTAQAFAQASHYPVTVGAAFADVTSRSLGVAEFADNDLFSNTEVRSPRLAP